MNRPHVPPEPTYIFRCCYAPTHHRLSFPPPDPVALSLWALLEVHSIYTILHIALGFMSPKPILKQCPQQQDAYPFPALSTTPPPRRVHFPPTPTLTSTYAAHSSATYDRSPVSVSPNQCALPGRHEREFVCSDDSRPYQTAEIKGGYFHPRAYEACAPEPLGYIHLYSALSYLPLTSRQYLMNLTAW
jgi:hypothetical protein